MRLDATSAKPVMMMAVAGSLVDNRIICVERRIDLVERLRSAAERLDDISRERPDLADLHQSCTMAIISEEG